MRIGELSKLSGVSVETIRYYEAQGLIPKAQRSLNNYRAYSEGHLKRLSFIRHCRSLDMSLDDIRLLSNVDARRSDDAARVHALINEHMHKIDEQIDALKKLRQHLGLLALCCHGNHQNGEPCGLIEGLTNQACCHMCVEMQRKKGGKKAATCDLTKGNS